MARLGTDHALCLSIHCAHRLDAGHDFTAGGLEGMKLPVGGENVTSVSPFANVIPSGLALSATGVKVCAAGSMTTTPSPKLPTMTELSSWAATVPTRTSSDVCLLGWGACSS